MGTMKDEERRNKMEEQRISKSENEALRIAQGSRDCVVLLPGFGYLFDRDLFVQAKACALDHGVDVLELSFGTLPFDKKNMKASIDVCLPIAMRRACMILDELPYERCHFVGKSFGTVAAVKLRKRYGDQPALLFTPLKQTLPLIEAKDRIAYGSRDPFLDEEDQRAYAKLVCSEKLFCAGANHSLVHEEECYTKRYLKQACAMTQRFMDEFSIR